MIVKQISEQVLPQNLHSVYSDGQSTTVAGIAGCRFVIHSFQMMIDTVTGGYIQITDSDFNSLWLCHVPDNTAETVYQFNFVLSIPFGKGFVLVNPGTTRDTNVQYSIETK